MKTPKTVTLNAAELRLALVTWRAELLSLGNKYPENFPYPSLSNRLSDLDAALRAIDTSTSVTLVPVDKAAQAPLAFSR